MWRYGCTAAILAALAIGCGDSTGPSAPAICFSVSGFNVSVQHLWNSGAGNHSANTQGISAFTENVNQGSESHSLAWSNIKNDYTVYAVTSFTVRIDGKDYSYPANRC